MTHQLFETVGGKLYVNADENEMELLKSTSEYERVKVDYILRHLHRGMSFVDVGAHIGYFTMLAARLVGVTGQVWAFEPNAENARWLLASATENNYRNIIMRSVAVGAGTTKHAIMYQGASSGQHSMLPVSDKFIEVYQTSLNAAIGSPVHMLKIDVEGMEAAVLQGASKIISHQTKILIDLHPDLGVDPAPVQRFLTARGFKMYDVRSGFVRLDRIPSGLVELLAECA